MINSQFKIVIVDDEPEARSLLKSLLLEIQNVSVVGEADNAEAALYKIVEHYPNLVLMDINMPGKSGMELIELLKSRNVDVPVVLVSAHEKYAVQAIRNQIYDFLLKPISKEDLSNLVEKYRRLNKKDFLPGKLMEVLGSIKEDTKIRINSRHSYILINPSEIVYCMAEDGYTVIHLKSGKTEVSNTSLTHIESRVSKQNFHRLGRAVLINLEYVRSVNKGTDSVLLEHNSEKWEVFASHRSIKDLLEGSYNYA